MDLKNWTKIILLSFFFSFALYGQEAEVRCINPDFDTEVAEYLSFTIPTISVAEAYSEQEKHVFLDAREMEEYNVSHIENAWHVGYENFDIQSVKSIPKDASIIVYCSIGYRSEKIGEKLVKAGYKNIHNLYGSIFEWINQHHPIYHKKKETNTIHTYNKKWSKWVNNEFIKKTW